MTDVDGIRIHAVAFVAMYAAVAAAVGVAGLPSRAAASSGNEAVGHAAVGQVAVAQVAVAQAAGGQTAVERPADDKPWSGIGRPATPAEIAAWDIDVRADFTGLPPGSGSVDKGMEVWEAKCALCHGTFGESNEVFTPIVGGTTQEDVRSGRVANLLRPDFPQRTTLMKLSRISTLWDYINRAMPWTAPKSLSVEEVYAVTAYILNLGDIVPADFVLSNENIAEVQQRLPNRNGLVFYEPMWSVSGKPDVQGDACMADCATEAQVRSQLPGFARDAHGNLAAQNRIVGPVRGADTTRPPLASLDEADTLRRAARATVAPATARPPAGKPVGSTAASPAPGAMPAGTPAGTPAESSAGTPAESPAGLAAASNCLACHDVTSRRVGPSFREVADRYKAQPGAAAVLAERVKNGGQGAWGPVPMPGNAGVADEAVERIVGWILDGAP